MLFFLLIETDYLMKHFTRIATCFESFPGFHKKFLLIKYEISIIARAMQHISRNDKRMENNA